MLNLVETRIGKTFHRNVAAGIQIETEGCCLQYVREGGATVVKPSDAGTSQQFAGVAYSRNTALTRMVAVEALTVPATAPYTITLNHTPINIRVVNNVGSALASDTLANVAPGKYNLTGAVLTFDAGIEGTVVNVSYDFTPSVLEAIELTGNGPAGGLPSSVIGVIGVINTGDIATDMFDVTSDWSTAVTVKMGADGMFTTGTGTVIPGATILRAPQAGSPSLVVSLR